MKVLCFLLVGNESHVDFSFLTNRNCTSKHKKMHNIIYFVLFVLFLVFSLNFYYITICIYVLISFFKYFRKCYKMAYSTYSLI